MSAKVRLTSPPEIVASIPFLIGHHPTDSVVVLFMRDKLLRLVMRVDRDDWDTEATISAVARFRLDHHHEDIKALVVVYGPTDNQQELLQALGVHVLDLIEVRDDLCRVVCFMEGCDCDQPWVPVGDVNTALVKTEPLASREAVVARLNPQPPAASPGLPRPGMQRLTELWAEGRRLLQSRQPIPDDVAFQISLAFTDIPVRDHFLSSIALTAELPDLDLAIDVATRARNEACIQAYSVASTIAYLCGNTVLAVVAAQHALAGDPTHRLSILMLQTTRAVMPPSYLAKSLLAGHPSPSGETS